MFRDETEWSPEMKKTARILASKIDGTDCDRGSFEAMEAEIVTLRNTVAGLLSLMVERGTLTTYEATDLINAWGWR